MDQKRNNLFSLCFIVVNKTDRFESIFMSRLAFLKYIFGIYTYAIVTFSKYVFGNKNLVGQEQRHLL